MIDDPRDMSSCIAGCCRRQCCPDQQGDLSKQSTGAAGHLGCEEHGGSSCVRLWLRTERMLFSAPCLRPSAPSVVGVCEREIWHCARRRERHGLVPPQLPCPFILEANVLVQRFHYKLLACSVMIVPCWRCPGHRNNLVKVVFAAVVKQKSMVALRAPPSSAAHRPHPWVERSLGSVPPVGRVRGCRLPST